MLEPTKAEVPSTGQLCKPGCYAPLATPVPATGVLPLWDSDFNWDFISSLVMGRASRTALIQFGIDMENIRHLGNDMDAKSATMKIYITARKYNHRL